MKEKNIEKEKGERKRKKQYLKKRQKGIQNE